jgi:hypothetical protein
LANRKPTTLGDRGPVRSNSGENSAKSLLMQCVVMAGGLATRPFIAHQLEWMRNVGVSKVLFCVGYRGEILREYVGDGSRRNLTLEVVPDGPELRGTAGALSDRLQERRALGPERRGSIEAGCSTTSSTGCARRLRSTISIMVCVRRALGIVQHPRERHGGSGEVASRAEHRSISGKSSAKTSKEIGFDRARPVDRVILIGARHADVEA